jgi:hypothetical protein
LRWEAARRQFVDPCDGRVYPEDGQGLVQYPTELRVKKKGGLSLFVDLRQPKS